MMQRGRGRTKEREGLTAFLPSIVMILLLLPLAALAQEPFPAQVKDVKMGVPMSKVISMIEGGGTHEVKPLPLPNRKALVWTLPSNPYYTKMKFDFTEKDRLFLIRFDLKNLSFRDARSLKKALFEKYGISWDAPWTMKIKGNDALMYGPPGQGKVYLFELTDPKTGDKSIELLDVPISKEDRAGSAPLKDLRQGQEPKKGESAAAESKGRLQEGKQSVAESPSTEKGADDGSKAKKAQPQ